MKNLYRIFYKKYDYKTAELQPQALNIVASSVLRATEKSLKVLRGMGYDAPILISVERGSDVHGVI